jgi:lipid A 3-O-deacylase
MRALRHARLALLAGLIPAAGVCADAPAGPALSTDVVTAARLLFGASSITLYTENDKYFAGTDRHYTNGFKLSFLGETNLNQSPGFVQTVAKYIPTLPRESAGKQRYKVGVAIGQNIYTPTVIHTPDPDPNDRPYAAWLYGALSFQAENPDRTLLRVVELAVGVVGPSALGEQIQNGWHDVIHVPHAEGWAHQLHDEPGFVLSWERRYRLHRVAHAETNFGTDLLGRFGLSVGNVNTSLRSGLTLRAGWKLPADFGPDLIRAAGGDASAVSFASFYLYGTAEGRAVARDIFLDGNTWRSSPSVSKRPLVGDFAVGAVARFPVHAGWLHGLQVAYTQNYRTKEFYGQLQRDVFGSITLSLLH